MEWMRRNATSIILLMFGLTLIAGYLGRSVFWTIVAVIDIVLSIWGFVGNRKRE